MNNISPLRFGYFKDFSDPTFLFFGNRASLEALLDALLSLPLRRSIHIHADSRFASVACEGLTLCLTSVAEGLRRQSNSQSDSFEWRLSSDQALQFAKRVRGVIDAPQPCHDYLETEALDEVVVVVSKDEYPEGWPGDRLSSFSANP